MVIGFHKWLVSVWLFVLNSSRRFILDIYPEVLLGSFLKFFLKQALLLNMTTGKP